MKKPLNSQDIEMLKFRVQNYETDILKEIIRVTLWKKDSDILKYPTLNKPENIPLSTWCEVLFNECKIRKINPWVG
jgi:hypothetical protein